MDFTVMLQHTLPVIVMAAIVMILVGIVKMFIKPKIINTWFSRLYFFLAVVFSFGAVAFYYGVILKIAPFIDIQFFTDVGSTIGATQILYPLYRKYGGRKTFLWLIELFKGQNVDLDTIIEYIEQIIAENGTLLDEQKANIDIALKTGLPSVLGVKTSVNNPLDTKTSTTE